MNKPVRLTPEHPEADLLERLSEALDAASAALAVVDPDDARPPGPRAAAFCQVADMLNDACWLAAEAAAAANRPLVQRVRALGWQACAGCQQYFPAEELSRHVYRGGDGQPAKTVPEQAWYECAACAAARGN